MAWKVMVRSPDFLLNVPGSQGEVLSQLFLKFVTHPCVNVPCLKAKNEELSLRMFFSKPSQIVG